MSKIKREIDIDEIFELIHQLDPKEQLLLISKIAEGISYKAFPKRPRKPVSSYKAFGIWRDRDEMKDSLTWIQELRRKEERRLSY